MVGCCLYSVVTKGYTFYGNNLRLDDNVMKFVAYNFYISKLYEFMDTFIMMASGNLRQISLLHVSHHIIVSIITWYTATKSPGGDAWWCFFINTLVHVVMYMYYGLAAMGIDKKYLSWSKYLTLFQMTQFVTMMIQNGMTLITNPGFPKDIAIMNFSFAMFLFIMFSKFYFKKYQTKENKSL